MKTFYSEAKIHFGNCMSHEDRHAVADDVDDDAAADTTPTCLLSNNTTTNNNNHSNANYHEDTRHDHVAFDGDGYDDDDVDYESHTDDNSSFVQMSSSPQRSAHNHHHTTSTYDTSQRPFKCDQNRGRWSSAWDFYFANTSQAFGSLVFSEGPVYGLMFAGFYFLPAYLLAIFMYALPVFAMQTFLGQFSSTGWISAFRVAPLFKGIGYSILIINLTSLAYYGVVAAVPLIYAANALKSQIPWMNCDNTWNSVNCSNHSNYDENELDLNPHATVEFYHYLLGSVDDHRESNLYISWPVLCAMFSIWLLVLGILLKRVSFIGKFLRFACIVLICIFVSVALQMIGQLDLSLDTIKTYLKPTFDDVEHIGKGIGSSIFLSTAMLGPAYGSALAMASHNNFRRDSERQVYLVTITHVVVVIIAVFLGRSAIDYFEDHVGFFHYHYANEEHFMQFLYLCYAYLFGSFQNMANVWSFVFFAMLFLAEFCAMLIQMQSVLSSIFDEFPRLRTKKTRFTIGLVLLLLTASIYFCTKQGLGQLHRLSLIVLLTNGVISLALIMMTVWIYGRKRFQCDLQFMLGRTISYMKIFMIRFVTPVFLLITILQALFHVKQGDTPSELMIVSQTLVYIVAVAYMIYKISRTTGSLRQRLKQCFQPHDWHPVDADNLRFYEDVMGTSEMLVFGETATAAKPFEGIYREC